MLTHYDYPGNIRELKSILQSAVNLAKTRPIAPDHLLPSVRSRNKVSADIPLNAEQPLSLAENEKAHILKIYRHTGENKSQTARLLGIGINTLRRKLESYGME
jgi:DNA-binding NtrC family response regulator